MNMSLVYVISCVLSVVKELRLCPMVCSVLNQQQFGEYIGLFWIKLNDIGLFWVKLNSQIFMLTKQ